MYSTEPRPELATLAALILAMGIATIFLNKIRFFQERIEAEISGNRFHSIDGLRGFLALGVVMHHLTINYHFYHRGAWELTPSRFNTFIGTGAVGFFFMITAFLFWGRALSANGRFEATAFYLSRIRRTVPLYVFSVMLLVITALALTHFKFQVSVLEFLRQILSWTLFTIFGMPQINGFGQTSLINTVYWSLVYEWKFYLTLPFLALFARPRMQWFLATVSAFCVYFFTQTGLEWFFLFGSVTAVLVRIERLRKLAASPAASPLALVCILATILWQPMVYQLWGAVLLFIPFYIFASGNTLFGILTIRASRFLGLVSYGIYLLHNWVLYIVFRLVNHFIPVASLSLGFYWCIGLSVVCVSIAMAALGYRYIEFRYIRFLGSEYSPNKTRDHGHSVHV